MIINLKQIYDLINNEEISAYQIGEATSVSRQAIAAVRRGDRDLENFQLKTIIELQKFINTEKSTMTNTSSTKVNL